MAKDILWKLEPHTKAKHEILKKYFDAWLPILSRFQDKMVYIDGFSGPGEYEQGEEGSPIIAINSVINHAIKINSEIHFLFIEKDKERHNFLQNKIGQMNLPNNIKVKCIQGEFQDVISGLLDKIEKEGFILAPTFAFIDPFGFKGADYEIIKRILKNPRCEILFNFMYEEINRFVELEQNKEICNALFGCSDWEKIKGVNDPKKRLEILHGLYKNQLKKIAKYVLSFKMKNKFNKEDYFLFFATNNIKGLMKMKESMWKVDPTGDFSFSDATYNPNQTLLFELEPNYAYLKRLIIDKYKGTQVSSEELEKFVLIETPFRETHYKTKILKVMEENKEIEIINDSRKRKGTYPEGTIIRFN